MQHKCKVTVIDKKCFNDYQEKYLADPKSGPCPFYNVGDEFIFERYGGDDTFWCTGNSTQCGEAWDCISRYIYTALQGGSIMRGWTNDERMMIACCNDGTRPVILKLSVWITWLLKLKAWRAEKVQAALAQVPGVKSVTVRLDRNWAEVFADKGQEPEVSALTAAVEALGYKVTGID